MEIVLEVTRALCPLRGTADAHGEEEREEKCVAFGPLDRPQVSWHGAADWTEAETHINTHNKSQ